MSRMLRPTEFELNELLGTDSAGKPKGKGQGAKYGSKSTSGYHSKKEALRARDLKFEAHAGIITEYTEHPVYLLIPKQKGERAVTYTPDFRYRRDGALVVEDVKSEATKKKESYIIKRKLMLQVHGIKVLET